MLHGAICMFAKRWQSNRPSPGRRLLTQWRDTRPSIYTLVQTQNWREGVSQFGAVIIIHTNNNRFDFQRRKPFGSKTIIHHSSHPPLTHSRANLMRIFIIKHNSRESHLCTYRIVFYYACQTLMFSVLKCLSQTLDINIYMRQRQY